METGGKSLQLIFFEQQLKYYYYLPIFRNIFFLYFLIIL